MPKRPAPETTGGVSKTPKLGHNMGQKPGAHSDPKRDINGGRSGESNEERESHKKIKLEGIDRHEKEKDQGSSGKRSGNGFEAASMTIKLERTDELEGDALVEVELEGRRFGGAETPDHDMKLSAGWGGGAILTKVEAKDEMSTEVKDELTDMGKMGSLEHKETHVGGLWTKITIKDVIEQDNLGKATRENNEVEDADASEVKQRGVCGSGGKIKVKAEVEDKLAQDDLVKIEVGNVKTKATYDPGPNTEGCSGSGAEIVITAEEEEKRAHVRVKSEPVQSVKADDLDDDNKGQVGKNYATGSSTVIGVKAEDKDEQGEANDLSHKQDQASDTWYEHSRGAIKASLVIGGPLASLTQSHPHLIDLIMDEWSTDVEETPEELASAITFVNDTKQKHVASHSIYGTLETYTTFCSRLFRAGYLIENKDVQTEMGRYSIHWDDIQDDPVLFAAMTKYAAEIDYHATMGTGKKAKAAGGLPSDRWNARLRKLMSNHYKDGKEKPLMVAGYLAGKVWAWLQEDAGVEIGSRGGLLSEEQKMEKLCIDNEGFRDAVEAVVKVIRNDPDHDIDIVAEDAFRPVVKSLTWTNFERHSYQNWLRRHLLDTVAGHPKHR